MAENLGNSPFISKIKYHNYVALLCQTDAEWTRARPSRKEAQDDWSVFIKKQRRLIDLCHKLKENINEQYKTWHEANESIEPARKDCLSAGILNPMSFLTFGHPDDLGIVLLDDLDPLHWLTGEMTNVMEEVSLGLCPKTESLGPWGKNKVFCALDSLMPPEYNKSRTKWEEKRHPLLVFTKYRMDAFGTMGSALLFQQNLLRAMAERVVKTLRQLRRHYKKPAVSGLIGDKRHLELVRCVFLDLQGPEEIGTLIFCHNYSIAFSLIGGLRELSYKNVIAAEFDKRSDRKKTGRLEGFLHDSPVHRSVIKLGRANSGRDPTECDIGKIYSNHVFRWTHSSLAVSPRAFFEPDGRFGGCVEARCEVQVSPGHRIKAQQTLNESRSKQTKCRISGSDYHSFEIGTGDLIASPAKRAKEATGFLVPLASAFSYTRENMFSFGCKCDEGEEPGRAVVDIATALAIPVPRIRRESPDGGDLIFGPINKQHFAPFGEILPMIEKKLCYADDDQSSRENQGPFPSKLNVHKLKAVPREYGIPVSLRRTFEYLFQDFANIMRDPFLFDTIIDLYDTFATLHAVLTEYLPRRLKEEGLRFIDEIRVEQLAALAEAIHNALAHRMLRAYPEVLIREMSVDFRGGLNQVLFAGDVPIKCGLGILRKYVYGDSKKARVPDNGRLRRDCVGAIIHIGLTPGVASCPLRIGTEDYAKLAFFQVDVPHVLHVPSYCDNFHEVFHLLFDSLCAQYSNKKLFSINDPPMADRVSEVFANLLCLLFVFGCDYEKFLYFQLCTFSKNLAHVGKDNNEAVLKATELLIRLFIVANMVRRAGSQESWTKSWPKERIPPDELKHDFEQYIENFGCFITGFEDIWNGPRQSKVRQFCHRQFESIYARTAQYLPSMWQETFQIYSHFSKEGPFNYREKGLRKFVEYSIAHGRPLIRVLYPKGQALEPLRLTCCLLREYVPSKPLSVLKNKQMHLPRPTPERTVDFSQGLKPDKKWNEFLLDLGSASTFCPVPSFRRMRLLKQITIIKTLWDLSSGMRSKRFWEILQDNWPKSELFVDGETGN